MKLVPGCYWKISVGLIQNGHTYLLPLQVFGRSCQECRLVVQTCLLQLISFLDIRYPSGFLFKTFFVDCLLVCTTFIGSVLINPEACPRVCLQNFQWAVSKPYIDIFFPAGLWKVMARVTGFGILPVSINIFIVFKVVPRVIQVCSCVGKCWIKGHQGPLV